MNKLKTIYETIAAVYADKYGQSLGKFFDPLSRLLRLFLIYVIPFIIGAYATDLIKAIPLNQTITSPSVWLTLFRDNWIILPLLFLFFLGLLWSNKIDYKKTKINALHDALLWMYHDLNFHTKKYSTADIRITIWAPLTKNQKIESYRMLQILDYVPPLGKLNKPKGPGARKHKTAGRVFRFTRSKDNEILGIGIAGLCVIDFVQHHQPKVKREVIPPDVNFVDYMVTNWNFTRPQAERLTADRRSYLCGPLMDRSAHTLYGIIYMDSASPDALSSTIANKIEKVYLTRLADLFEP